METLRVPDTHVLGWTPGTSLRVAGTGRQDERALLLRLLRSIWRCGDSDAVIELMRDRAGPEGFRKQLDNAAASTVDPAILQRFRRGIGGETSSSASSERWNATMIGCRAMSGASRRDLIELLRRRLARACLHVLKPRLVILDEFQRYPDVLRDAEQATKLEHVLLRERPTLLLSATPLQDERRHARSRFASRVQTAALPVQDPSETKVAMTELEELSTSFSRLRPREDPDHRASVERARAAKQQVERRLLPIMSRWQRPRDDEATRAVPLVPKPEDIKSYLAFQRVVDIAATAGGLRLRMTVEYWKSAPYLMSFMRGYKVKSAVDDAWKQGDLRRTMVRASGIARRLCRCGISSSTDRCPSRTAAIELADLALERSSGELCGYRPAVRPTRQWTLQEGGRQPRDQDPRVLGVACRSDCRCCTPRLRRRTRSGQRRGREEHHRGANPPQLRPVAFAALRRTQRPPATQRALLSIHVREPG